VNFVVEKMGTSINEFLNTAIRTGTEVPIGMQPLVNKMAEMGTLTADLGQITWAESMTQGFNKVAEAINHLAQALGFQLPAAAQQAANGMNAEFDRVRIPGFSGRFLEPEMMEDVRNDVPQMARGGYVPARPGGTLINVGEGGQGEYVVPSSKMGRGGVTVNVTVQGSLIQERDLAATVMEAVADEAYRLGLVPR
jgi:hypothetical protein